MEDVAEGLRELEDSRGVSLEDLANNDVFVDTVLEASQAAMRTSQGEKRSALRNAIMNAALPGAPDSAYQQMYLRFIDEFNEWHIRLLALFDDPVRESEELGRPLRQVPMGALEQVLKTAYPALSNHHGFYTQIWNDLYSRGLVNTEELHGMMTGHGLAASRTSALGKAFLKFISEPEQAG